MSTPAIKWGQVERYCRDRGFTITSSGGEKIIHAPRTGGGDRTRQQVRIAHRCCSHAGNTLMGCYVSKLRNVLKIDLDELLKY